MDDIGYVQQSRDEMEVLFTLLAERYERRTLIITSNLVFSQWDQIFKDSMTTAAAIDRVVQQRVIVEFGKEISSHRAQHAAQRIQETSPTRMTVLLHSDGSHIPFGCHSLWVWVYLIGVDRPLAQLGWRSNLAWRIAATLNGYTGQVTYLQGYHIGIRQLLHPDLCIALQPQEWKWTPKLPSNWPADASPKAKHLNLPIQLLSLPAYASWTNPIEKLWRNLRQEVLHLHRFKDDWDATKQAVSSFLDQFAHAKLRFFHSYLT